MPAASRGAALAAASAAALSPRRARAAGEFTDVFKAGDAGYACYMNPSALVVGGEGNGSILVFSEARWASCGDFDCLGSICGKHDIALRRSDDGGRTWGAMELVVKVDRDFGPPGPAGSSIQASIFNISPVRDSKSGDVLVLFNFQPAWCNTAQAWDARHPNCRQTFVLRSADGGRSWAAPTNITSQIVGAGGPAWARTRNPLAVTPGPSIQLSSGRLLTPAYGCTLPAGATCGGYGLNSSDRSFALLSDDGGHNWRVGSGHGAAVSAAEPMAVELPGGDVLMNARNDKWPHDGNPHPRYRFWLRSSDGGETWAMPPADVYQPLPEPACEAALIRDGDLLLFANPASQVRRINMTFRASRDWGLTWERSEVAYANSSWYSSLVAVPALPPSPGRDALLFFVKDCDDLLADGRHQKGADQLGVPRDHNECQSISMWRAPLLH